ncbi:hypothetical protein DFH09DRAFT_1329186 [Mycena vulgaris]|nr:hypothetical protein DFH09DRAFT_1329186 [Mycena vulgaris]
MALQTPHSSAPASSSTTSPPDSGTASTEPGFSLGASPPLILAFLAVGMFVISMLVFFGWRRLTAGRRRWMDPTTTPPARFGEIPKLWDVWSPSKQPRETGTAEWHSIQPLAATVWKDTPLRANSDGPRHETLVAAASAHLRRRYRSRRSDESSSDAKLAQNSRPPVQLQIAVTIAMPCQNSIASRTDPDEQPLDYSIGLYEVPWKTTD